MARIMSPEFVFGMIVERTINFGFCRSNARTASSASCAKDASTVCPARACLTRSMYFGSYSTTRMFSDMDGYHYKSLHHRGHRALRETLCVLCDLCGEASFACIIE